MARAIVDLSLLIEENMPTHKLFQRPVITKHLTHESSLGLGLGVPGDAMTFQTNFIVPLELFMGKALCFDLRHIPDLGEITAADMEAAEMGSRCGLPATPARPCAPSRSSTTSMTEGFSALSLNKGLFPADLCLSGA